MNKRNPKSRREIMQAVRGKNTKPEMLVRRLMHRMVYRYRLHKQGLKRRPDIVFAGRRKVIFVHGCFWHQHDCPSGRNRPASNINYWNSKLNRNKERDEENQRTLESEGWAVLVIWECEIKK